MGFTCLIFWNSYFGILTVVGGIITGVGVIGGLWVGGAIIGYVGGCTVGWMLGYAGGFDPG